MFHGNVMLVMDQPVGGATGQHATHGKSYGMSHEMWCSFWTDPLAKPWDHMLPMGHP